MIIVAIFQLAAMPADADEIRILMVDEPPSNFTNREGKPSGFAVDVVRQIQVRLGSHAPIEVMPEKRALKIASESANIVLFSFSRTPDREDEFHWIMLLLRKPWVLYSKKDAGFKISTLEDARKINWIGVVRGDVRANHLKRQGFLNLQEVTRHEQNVKKLMRNRIQMLYYESPGMAYACRRLGIPISEFEAVLVTETSDVYLVMSKRGTDSETEKRWREAARRLKEEGTFGRMAEKWCRIIREESGMPCEVRDGALNYW